MIPFLAQKSPKTEKNRIYNRICKLAVSSDTQKQENKNSVIKEKIKFKRVRKCVIQMTLARADKAI